jgi:hypothetical protein
MNLPSFNADVIIVSKAGREVAEHFQSESYVAPMFIRVGGWLGVCSSDPDCNEMFSGDMCGPHARCYENGGGVACICLTR